MDPNANLEEQRKISARMIAAYENEDGNGINQDDANRLAELVQALDEWISKGGFLPEDWEAALLTKGVRS